MFWTYVIALAEDPEVRRTAEDLAREALRDGNLLRRERRIAWRQEREAARETNGMDAPASAALLESLLLKDMIAWSRRLPEPQRAQLLTLQSGSLAEQDLPEGDEGAEPAGSIEEIRRRALQRAEQLSDIYLAEADRAADQDSMELAQKLAAQSIMRLAAFAAWRRPSGAPRPRHRPRGAASGRRGIGTKEWKSGCIGVSRPDVSDR